MKIWIDADACPGAVKDMLYQGLGQAWCGHYAGGQYVYAYSPLSAG